MENTFVFDMDGVLIDSERLILECILEVAPDGSDRAELRLALMESLGVTKEELHRIMREHMGAEFQFDACEKRAEKRYFERLELEGIPLKPGARELLEFLSQKGCRIALASSTYQALVEKELTMAGLLDFFEPRVTGDMVAHSKPAPDIYRLACQRLGVAPETAFAIEDSPNGIRSAHAAGLGVIAVPDLAPVTEELRPLCTKVFETLFDVRDWIKACVFSESD